MYPSNGDAAAIFQETILKSEKNRRRGTPPVLPAPNEKNHENYGSHLTLGDKHRTEEQIDPRFVDQYIAN